MSLPTSLSSGLISDSARGASRARPGLERRSAARDLAGRAPVAAQASSQGTGPSRFARQARPPPASLCRTSSRRPLRRPIRAKRVSASAGREVAS